VAEVAADHRLVTLLDRALRQPGAPAGTRARLTARRAIATYWQPGGQEESRRASAQALRRHAARAAVTAPLSRRETEVVALLSSGRENAEIAAVLGVSVHTVERHVANVFVKIGVRNRAAATAWAHRRGIAG
jgi:DNA-binding CsgD family transcriptional regulator